MNRKIIIIVLAVMAALAAEAKKTSNTDEARRIFDKAYAQVFGQQGSSFRYDVNISGIYKTHGTIWMKGERSKFIEEKVDGYNDGTTAYMVYKRKKTVEIHPAKSDKKDKYSGKFKFTLDDFNYSMERRGTTIELTLKQRREAKGTIKEVKATLDAATLAPQTIKVKVVVLWASITISQFRSGGISDQTFAFPRQKYQDGYKYVDKR